VVGPFPWHALPRVAAVHARAVSRVRRVYPGVRARDVAAQLSSLIGHPVDIEVRRVTIAKPALRNVVALVNSAQEHVYVELEPELALAVASALTGGKLPKIARDRTIDPEVLGAATGIVLWLARSAGVELSLSEDTTRGIDCVLIDCIVRVGALRSAARVAVAIPELDRTPRLAANDVLHRLGDTPLTVAVVIGWGTARAGDLTDLMAGDVVVVDQRCCAAIAGTRGLQAVAIAPADGHPRVRIEDGRVELAAPLAPSEEASAMTDDTGATMQLPALEEGARLADDLAELPLTVRIEIGSATLSAREWASIGTGDVLVLDSRVGDPVSLRIAGKVLARGELVEVDGAVGIRITERTT
jgi:type III secretion system YscQ/HrcQ family protein